MNKEGNKYFIKMDQYSAEEGLIQKTPFFTDNVNSFYNYYNTERETSSGSLNSLRILSLNCCSLRSQAKRGIFNAIIYEQISDVVLGCESHLDSSYNSSEIFPVGKSRWKRRWCFHTI